MTKIAFFDIDGTMVDVPNDLMHPTPETKRVIQEFQRQGNLIVVATARTRIPESVHSIAFDGYICADGHYIEMNNEVLVNNIFTKQQIID
jgi:hydroxymethylpyrimidine pyrophosphatase-like HAD family hydrolase